MSSTLQDWIGEVSAAEAFGGTKRIDIFSKDYSGNTLLHLAAIKNDATIIRLLIQAGLSPNVQGEHLYTPLHEAVEQGNYAAMHCLLKLKADQNIKNELGLTALDLAITNDDKYAIQILRTGELKTG